MNAAIPSAVSQYLSAVELRSNKISPCAANCFVNPITSLERKFSMAMGRMLVQNTNLCLCSGNLLSQDQSSFFFVPCQTEQVSVQWALRATVLRLHSLLRPTTAQPFWVSACQAGFPAAALDVRKRLPCAIFAMAHFVSGVVLDAVFVPLTKDIRRATPDCVAFSLEI